jgi:hypothetical protein
MVHLRLGKTVLPPSTVAAIVGPVVTETKEKPVRTEDADEDKELDLHAAILPTRLMPAITDNLPGPRCVPGDVLHLRDELEDPDVAPGYRSSATMRPSAPPARTRRTGRFAGRGSG